MVSGSVGVFAGSGRLSRVFVGQALQCITRMCVNPSLLRILFPRYVKLLFVAGSFCTGRFGGMLMIT